MVRLLQFIDQPSQLVLLLMEETLCLFVRGELWLTRKLLFVVTELPPEPCRVLFVGSYVELL